MVYLHFKNLEENTYQRRPADYIFLLIMVAIVTLGVAALLKSNSVWSIFYLVIVYLNCKLNRHMQFFLLGIPVPVPAPYLPFIFLLLGTDITEISGFIIGHICYFFEDVFPKLPTSRGRKPFTAPAFLRNLCRPLEQ
jgi:Derlin-2/3